MVVVAVVIDGVGVVGVVVGVADAVAVLLLGC